MSEKNLESRLPEQESFAPPSGFVEQANINSDEIYNRFDENWPSCWKEAANLLDWFSDYDEVLDDSEPPFYKWFTDGSLNACYNCVDRHVENGSKNKAAIIWEGENGERVTLTYSQLQREVNEFAAALRSLGVGEDDIVTMYLPMIPELPIAMLACSRIGAPHNVVFAGFSAEALATRMEDASSKHLITCDGYYRRGEPLKQKEKADKAKKQISHDLESVVVVDRLREIYEHSLSENEYDFMSLVEEHSGDRVEPVHRDSEDMLFLMYTSGTTGKPKGVKHTTAGYLSYVSWTAKNVLDIKPDDTYWCPADIGWITGHSYIVYGPLALGTTTVMYEGAPDYPDKDRLWRMVDDYLVDIYYTAPTAVRAYMKWGEEYPERHDLSSLRLLGTVGEPINPRAWRWYYKYIGDESCPIVDTWWQTETGGMMVTTLPGVGEMKPGSAGLPLPGIDARVLSEDGGDVEAGDAGYLTVNRPWPGMLRTVFGDDERFIEEYWEEYSDPKSGEWVYCPEDGAKIDDDGYITILGRVDDVINVSGHRLGTMEIESAVVGVKGVAEAAVVGGSHEVKGEAVYVYATPEEGVSELGDLREKVVAEVEEVIGPFARPEEVLFVDDLPKTRSGKIMRRLLEGLAGDEEIGDTSTLRNPGVVDELREKLS